VLLENKNFKPLKFYASVASVPGAAVALVSVALTANAALLRTYVPKFLFILLLLGNFIYFTFNLSFSCFSCRIVSTSAPQVHCSLLWFSMLVLSSPPTASALCTQSKAGLLCVALAPKQAGNNQSKR
jgi:hypothetical protein